MTSIRTAGKPLNRLIAGIAAITGGLGLIIPVGLATSAAAAGEVLPAAPPIFTPMSEATEALVPEFGALLGASVGVPEGFTNRKESTAHFEQQLGRKLDIHRTYADWTIKQPGPLVRDDAENGRTTAVSIFPGNTWANIAAGVEDAQIRQHARGLKSLNRPIIVTLHHEPEDDPQFGTPAEFVAAWRHYVDVYRAEGADNVSFAWILMSYTFGRTDGYGADAFYPGDEYVDWLAADGYNWFGCMSETQWRTFDDSLRDFFNWAIPKRKPLFIAEFGTEEDPATPGRKAHWLNEATETINRIPQIRAVSYYHTTYDGCSWWADSSPSSLDAFRNMHQSLSHTTQPAVIPTRVTTAIKSVGATQADVVGYVTPGSSSVEVSLEVSSTAGTTQQRLAILPADSAAHPVRLPLSDLQPQRTYNLRLTARNAAGAVTEHRSSITTKSLPSAVIGEPAVLNIGAFSLPVTVDTKGLEGTAAFEWGTTPDLGNRHAKTMRIAAGEGPATDTFWVGDLESNTTYYAQAVVSTADGEVRSPIQTVTTALAWPRILSVAGKPTSPTSATVQASLDLSKAAGSAWVRWGTTSEYGSKTQDTPVSIPAGATTVAVPVDGLAPGATYHAQLIVTTDAGSAWGDDFTFTMPKDPTLKPAASVGEPTLLTAAAFTVPITVDSHGIPAQVTMEYGTSSSLGTGHSKTVRIEADGEPITEGFWVGGLEPNTTYFVQAVVTTDAGTTRSAIRQVTTKVAWPKIQSVKGTPSGPTAALIEGSLDLSNAAGSAWVRWGTTSQYGSKTQDTPVSIPAGARSVAVPIDGLSGGTTYHAQLIVTTEAGTVWGDDFTFTTPAAAATTPALVIEAPTWLNVRAFTVPATVDPRGAAGTLTMEWGRTAALGNQHNKAIQVEAGSAPVTEPFWVGELEPSTTYYTQAVFTTENGVFRSPIRTVTTKQAWG